jgi:EAL domain-containing protein (putative c-di-GMP-specific phosphodiesterase class I)
VHAPCTYDYQRELSRYWIDVTLELQLHTQDRLRSALDNGEFFLEYQPIVMLEDRRCVGGEALVRWRREDGVLAASEFVAAMDNTPLSGELTYWVIDTVAAELREWLATHDDARITINVPPEILGRGGLAYAATRSGLRAHLSQIVLEIVERGVPDRLGLEALNLMAERGVCLALDDVTLTGANLAVLSRCKFDIIKIERQLIDQLKEGAPRPEWLTGIEALLKISALRIIAEGVESEHQAAALSAAGITMAQGFLFSRPLTARDFMNFYGERTADHPTHG